MNSKFMITKLNENNRLFINFLLQRLNLSSSSVSIFKQQKQQQNIRSICFNKYNQHANRSILYVNNHQYDKSNKQQQQTSSKNKYSLLLYALLFGSFTWIYPKYKPLLAKEISNQETNNTVQLLENENEASNSDEEEEDAEKNKKSKVSFRERKIIQYENRIRHYSTPDKVFRYFATVKIWNEKVNDYDVFMTPDDFVRSMTYGIRQPEGLGLDSYNKFDPKTQSLGLRLDENSVFKKLNPQGLIAFSDYLFLVTLLSTPTRHFEIAFLMFDIDGSGNIDKGEFDELQTIIRNQTSLGQRHRDTRMTGSVLKDNETLNEYFFGPGLDELLTVQKFTDFHKQLQSEVIKMEFDYCRQKEGNQNSVISEEAFCEMLLAYAGFNSSKTKKMLKRISKIYGPNSQGITFQDYESFFQVLRSIQDIDTALKFYTIAGAAIDKSILKHVSKTVAGVDLSDRLVDIVFTLFDDNGDGKLTQKEFIKVMKKRLTRGLQIPRDTGFVKFIESLATCTKETFFSPKP